MRSWRTGTTAIALFALGAFAALSVNAANDVVTPPLTKSVEQMITAAKTPADHEAIAAYYDKEAQAAHEKHAEHKKLADFYAATPALKTKADTLFKHCGAAAMKYEELAKEYEALAKEHREMAKSAK